MGWAGWIGLIALLIVVVYGASIIGGALLPSRSVAATYLRNELRRLGLASISELAIVELADRMVSTTEFMIKGGLKKGPINSYAEESAKIYAQWVYEIVMGDGDHSIEKIRRRIAQGAPDLVWEILAKYQPELFSLERLEMTQSTNSMLRDGYRREEERECRRAHEARNIPADDDLPL
jgi:hypothetical protein